VGEPDSGIKAV